MAGDGRGEVGEVVASGPNIMQGYWNDPAETALVLKQGRLHKGDLGRVDEDGDIWLVDRIKNMIKAGANRVSAKEVEEVIAEVACVQVCLSERRICSPRRTAPPLPKRLWSKQ